MVVWGLISCFMLTTPSMILFHSHLTLVLFLPLGLLLGSLAGISEMNNNDGYFALMMIVVSWWTVHLLPALGSQSFNLILAPPYSRMSDKRVYCMKYTVHKYPCLHWRVGLMVTYPAHAMIMLLIWSLLHDDTPAHPIVDLPCTWSSRHTVNLQRDITSWLQPAPVCYCAHGENLHHISPLLAQVGFLCALLSALSNLCCWHIHQ